MKVCRECVYLRWNDYRGRHECECRENLVEKFSPIDGKFFVIKDTNFHREANKDGNCVWFNAKKQKWWRKKKVYEDETKFTNSRVDEFLAYMRREYPEIVLQWEVIK